MTGIGIKFGGQSLTKRLRRALMHRPGEEFNAANWQAYGYKSSLPPPELARSQHDALCAVLERHGVELEYLEAAAGVQATATTDPALILDSGAIMLNSGKRERQPEVWPMARRLIELGIPIIEWLRPGEYADGGDLLWLDSRTLIAGLSYRTNEAGIARLRRAVEDTGCEVHMVEMPHWHGTGDVLHLMSAISLASERVAVVYPKALPIRMMRMLVERQFKIIEVSDEEFNTLGTNILAIDTDRVVMCGGNERTKLRLADHGIDVLEFDGGALCLPRGAGPTCHVLALHRD